MKNANAPRRVAIIGASGIGKNHAAWFAKNGAEICGFVGSSMESLEATRGVLQAKLGHAPHGFLEISELLKNEKPDAVCISSPPRLHFQHAKFCLENGVHTLCEKPLVYDSLLSMDAMNSQTRALNALAKEHGVLLATQMQYCFLAEKICEMADVSAEKIESFAMEMETKNLPSGGSHETIWIELASHPLSVLQKLFPDAQMQIDSIHCHIQERETTAQFQLQRADHSRINARITARYNPSTPVPLRRFTINNAVIDYAGRRNENGEFLTYLSRVNAEIEMPDLVDILIGNFLASCQQQKLLFVTGEDGAKNIDWMLQILERGQRA